MRRYPAAVADFVAVEPDRYSPSEPPVECQLSAAIIVSGRHLLRANCGNEKLMVSSPSVARNEQGARSIAAVDDQEVGDIYDHGGHGLHGGLPRILFGTSFVGSLASHSDAEVPVK